MKDHRTPTLVLLLTLVASALVSQTQSYPHNATNCEECHALPSNFGSSPMTVLRVGSLAQGKFVPGPEGGIHHRQGRYTQSGEGITYEVTGERVSISLLGDGFNLPMLPIAF